MEARARIENVIDAVIRKFEPQSRSSYEHWDQELANLENAIRASEPTIDPVLISSVRAQRIRIASEVGEFTRVIKLSESFIREYPATIPSFSAVATLRIDAHHAIGAHEVEVLESLNIAKETALRGSEYVYFLEKLARRHPGRLPADSALWQKLQEAIAQLRTLGYEPLPDTTGDPTRIAEVARQAAGELRRINRKRGEAALRDPR